MPVVSWASSGDDVGLEDSATSSRCMLLLGFVAAGLTAAAAVALLRRMSKQQSPAGPTADRTSPPLITGTTRKYQSPEERQRLYRHFAMMADDRVRANSGVDGNRKLSDSGLSSRMESDDCTSISRDETNSPNTSTLPGPEGHPKSAAHQFTMARPPPPPPLTPPELSPTVFELNHRRLNHGATPSGMDAFFDQPNPDYSSDEPMSQTTATSTAQSPPTHRRRSYIKSVSTGIPALTPSSTMNSEKSETAPSSYPPATTSLPGGQPGQEAAFSDSPQGIEVQGEIISVLDDAGAGWKRHTRVYGGGVCLACAASGSEGHGGFYGHNVRPEERF